MKKFVLCLGLAIFCLSCMIGCRKSSALTEVTLNEVAHSIFYAPQYVAIEKGYFKEEGIDLTLETGFGADKTMTAVISGDADIGFMGPEATIYQYQEGNQDYAVNFAQLTSESWQLFDFQKKKQRLFLGSDQGKGCYWRSKG